MCPCLACPPCDGGATLCYSDRHKPASNSASCSSSGTGRQGPRACSVSSRCSSASQTPHAPPPFLCRTWRDTSGSAVTKELLSDVWGWGGGREMARMVGLAAAGAAGGWMGGCVGVRAGVVVPNGARGEQPVRSRKPALGGKSGVRFCLYSCTSPGEGQSGVPKALCSSRTAGPGARGQKRLVGNLVTSGAGERRDRK